MRSNSSGRFRAATSLVAIGALLLVELGAGGVRAAPLAGDGPASAAIGHLVISEVMTGGASASDEFVELYNPAATSLTLDGLELVYVTASGATVTRKATWPAGTSIAANAHVLVANEAGLFAGVADVTYANGLAATGGSLALRAVGATSAVDAVGWGTATNAWLEAAAVLGFELRLACPEMFEPNIAKYEAAKKNGCVMVTEVPEEAVEGAHVVNTDVWASMGQEAEAEARRNAFKGFTVDADLMKLADPKAIFLHCLPAHRGEEVTADVIDGPQSRVWDEAENRLHVQKALLATLMGT